MPKLQCVFWIGKSAFSPGWVTTQSPVSHSQAFSQGWEEEEAHRGWLHGDQSLTFLISIWSPCVPWSPQRTVICDTINWYLICVRYANNLTKRKQSWSFWRSQSLRQLICKLNWIITTQLNSSCFVAQMLIFIFLMVEGKQGGGSHYCIIHVFP